MIRRMLGRTGLSVSVLALGTVKIGRDRGVKYPVPFTIPDDDAVIELLNTAADLGINLIDTAPAYGNSEERIGRLLPQVRGDFLISTKVGETFPAAVIKHAAASRSRFGICAAIGWTLSSSTPMAATARFSSASRFCPH
jgi:aryl-alcohol dehydrogenase-like predicted oxidoreductase